MFELIESHEIVLELKSCDGTVVPIPNEIKMNFKQITREFRTNVAMALTSALPILADV